VGYTLVGNRNLSMSVVGA